jgi:hypothetical protein
VPLIGITIDGQPYTFDQALELAKKNVLPLPYPVLSAVVSTIRARDAERSPEAVSVTELTGCPRAKVLRILDDYYFDLDQLLAVFRGTLVHEVLAKHAADHAVVETRRYRDYKGYRLYGTPDSVVLRSSGRYQLVDFKTTRRVPLYSPYSNHITQVNVYRWLLALPVDETDIDIVYISLDDAKVVSKRLREDRGHVWTDEDVEKFLDERFLPLARLVEHRAVLPVSMLSDDILSWACGYCSVVQQCLRRARTEGQDEWAVAQIIAATTGQKEALHGSSGS